MGYSYTINEPYEYHAFLWTAEDGMIDIGAPPGSNHCRAYAINNMGQVAGEYWLEGYWHSFLWTAEDGFIDIGDLGGGYSGALDINDLGQIVGWSEIASGEWRSYLWEEGLFIDLPTLPGGTDSWASACNNLGQIAGDSDDETGYYYAVLWTLSTPTPEEILDSIRDEIESLVGNSELSEGHGNALLAKVEAAEKQIEKGNPNAAINLLTAFINQVDALENAGKISLEAATALINLANDAISRLTDGT